MLKKADVGYRTYTMANRCLAIGAGIAMLGIWKGVNLADLAFLIVGVTTPILGGQAWKSVYTAKFKNGGTPATSKE